MAECARKSLSSFCGVGGCDPHGKGHAWSDPYAEIGRDDVKLRCASERSEVSGTGANVATRADSGLRTKECLAVSSILPLCGLVKLTIHVQAA